MTIIKASLKDLVKASLKDLVSFRININFIQVFEIKVHQIDLFFTKLK